MPERVGCASCSRTFLQKCVGKLIHGEHARNLIANLSMICVCSVCYAASAKELEVLMQTRFSGMNVVIVRVDDTLVGETVKEGVRASMIVASENSALVTYDDHSET